MGFLSRKPQQQNSNEKQPASGEHNVVSRTTSGADQDLNPDDNDAANNDAIPEKPASMANYFVRPFLLKTICSVAYAFVESPFLRKRERSCDPRNSLAMFDWIRCGMFICLSRGRCMDLTLLK